MWDYASPLSGYLVAFNEGFLHSGLSADSGMRDHRLLNALADVTEIPAPPATVANLLALFQAISAEFAARRESHVSVLQAYVHILLVEIARTCPKRSNPPAGTASALAQRFSDLVNDRRRIDHSVRTYSAALGVTPGHLAESVKLVTGRTPGQIIRETLLVEAKRLLVHTDDTVAQIAHELGFRDTAYFGRFFKRESGMTPGAFRQHSRARRGLAL